MKFNHLLLLIVAFFAFLWGGCSVAPEATNGVSQSAASLSAAARTDAALSVSPTVTRTSTITRTPTQSMTPSITPTLPPLESFRSRLLYVESSPAVYVADTCEYLRNRWDPERSAPGTIVIPVMWHGIESGAYSTSIEDFNASIYVAKKHGFETITMERLADFMETNARIPARAMVWTIDDRIAGTVEDYFMPVLTENGWVMSMAWPIADTDSKPGLWERVEALHATGRVEVQAHGWVHNIPANINSTDEYLIHEIIDPIALLEQHFGKRPIAYVWPGGGYTKRAVEIAREGGYRLGFTDRAPGPLMYNWVPLRQEAMAIGDPLLLLPREWGNGLARQIELSLSIGDAAAADARERYPAEADYFRTYCGGELPPLPAIPPE